MRFLSRIALAAALATLVAGCDLFGFLYDTTMTATIDGAAFECRRAVHMVVVATTVTMSAEDGDMAIQLVFKLPATYPCTRSLDSPAEGFATASVTSGGRTATLPIDGGTGWITMATFDDRHCIGTFELHAVSTVDSTPFAIYAVNGSFDVNH